MEDMLKEVENCRGVIVFCANVHARTLILLIYSHFYMDSLHYEAQAPLLCLGPSPFNFLIPIS